MLLLSLRRLHTARWVSLARTPSVRPGVEPLEDRTAPAVSFINPAGGDWSVPGNWSTGALPTPDDDVVIDQPGITVMHTSGTDVIRTLSLFDPLTLSGGSLALNGPSPFQFANSVFGQRLSVLGGSLSMTWQTVNTAGAGRLINDAQGMTTVHESTVNAPIDNEGLLVVEGNHARFGGDFTNPAGATLRIQGSSGFGAGILTVANGFTNAGAIEMTTTASPASSGLQVLSGVLTNTGSLDLFPGAGTSNTLHFQLDNQGTFTTDANVVFAVEGASTNSGTFRVNGGVLGMGVFALGPSFTNTATGVIAVAASSTLEINNLLLSNFSGGTLTGGTYQIAGTLQFAVQYGDVMLTNNAAGLLLDGPGSRILNQSGGDALDHFAANSAAGTFSLTNGRVLTTSGDLSNSGAVDIDASSQLSVSGTYTQMR